MAISFNMHPRLLLVRAARFWVVLSLGAALPLLGQEVAARGGNIYYVDGHGVTRQLTTGGMDSDPSLSCDGRTVIFVRTTLIPAGFEEPTNPLPKRTQIRMVGVMSEVESALIFDDPVVVGKSKYATFSEPRLAPDNRHAYFLIHYAVVEFGLVKLDLETRRARMISGALEWHVICAGRYA